MDAAEFNRRLHEKKPRRKSQLKLKCDCGKIGKYSNIGSDKVYCESCAIKAGFKITY